MSKKLAWLICGFGISGLISPAFALDTSVGANGIDAHRLHGEPYNLTGRKISIGQVEIGRPGKFGLDKAVAWNPALSLAGLYHRDNPAKSDTNVDEHASMVAMVMVGGGKKLRGVAPDAKLYASAVGPLNNNGQPEECLSSQHVAMQNGGDVRAINYSFGESLGRDAREEASLDGQALLTLCVDWSSRVHDTLYVIAGNQGSGGIPIPTDQYNGITTAYTTQRNGQYNKVDFANLSALPEGIGRRLIAREINLGERRAINLVAPGSGISVFDLEGKVVPVTGTSFAAPHITATIALLQEFGDRQLFSRQLNWSLDSRRHEVMKAVLLNSADKIQDTLGMSRTVKSKNNLTWLEGDAYQNEQIPLDIQMGTGQINAFRAYEQYSSGQWNSDNPVPSRGWNYSQIETKSYQDYVLQEPLQKDSFAAITLAWDRFVELEDNNENGLYDLGENFRDRGLNNLDIYLLPLDSEDSSSSVCASKSRVDSIEHIFCKVPSNGRYKIRVQYTQQINEATQAYALAWWSLD
ncbi:MAG: S8 family serine peptidase [Spirulinaceae cyanobacterium]